MRRFESVRRLFSAQVGILIALAVALPPPSMFGQAWSGIISAPRAVDWSNVGVQGGIPPRATNCISLGSAGQVSTFIQSVTASQISDAINKCASGQTVFLNAGTYNIDGFRFGSSNVTLRGAGATRTILNIRSNSPEGCHIGEGVSVNMCLNGANIGVDSPDHTATWHCDDTNGVCTQGRTSITLSSTTGLTVGHTIWLDQTDSAGYPAAGDVWISNWGNGESFARPGRGLLEGHKVTACGTSTPGAACTSSTITISPGLMAPVYRSTQSPGAWWANASGIIHDSGIEDLTMDITSNTNSGALYIINAANCWVKGVRMLYRNKVSSGQPRMLNVINGRNITIESNYIYGYFASSLVSIYSIAPHIVSSSLFQNNIIHAATNPFVQNSASWGNVFAFNYFNSGGIDSNFAQSSFILHGVSGYLLLEGNDGKNFSCDNIHSSHNFITLFRNHWNGQAATSSGTETQASQALYAGCRYVNSVGNVSGNSQWTSEENGQSPPSRCPRCVYELGWQGTNSAAVAVSGNDSNVKRTLLRWGNWESVTSGARFNATDVPSGIANYPNKVPANNTLPASFYLSAAPPDWWATAYGTPPWPAIGPDVANGSIDNGSSEPTGGHANSIPARLCFENVGNDSTNYNGSSPAVKAFDRATCYKTPPKPARPF